MNLELLNKLNDIIIEYQKHSNKILLDDMDLEILFNNIDYTEKDIIKEKYIFNKKEDIFDILNELFSNNNNEVYNIEYIKKYLNNDNTYNVVLKYLIENNYKLYDDSISSNSSMVQLYLKDINNYPRISKEEQDKLLNKNIEYLKIINNCKTNIINNFYGYIKENAKKNSIEENDFIILVKYQLNVLVLLLNENKFIPDESKIKKLLDDKLTSFINKNKYFFKKLSNRADKNNNITYIDKKISEKELKKQYEIMINTQKERIKVVNYIVEHNLRIVISIARFYTNKGLSFEDLIQEGNMGLIRSLDSYNDKLSSFSTYAYIWIRQKIRRALSYSDAIRLPVHFKDKLIKYNKFYNSYINEHNDDPTEEYTLKKLNITKDELYSIKYYLMSTVSLNDPVGEGEHGIQSEVGDFVEDKNNNIENEVIQKSLKIDLIDVLGHLSDIQKAVILLRFGIIPDKPLVVNHNKIVLVITNNEIKNDELNKFLISNNYLDIYKLIKENKKILKYIQTTGESMTLEQIGDYFEVSRERIRQIEENALRKLQNSKYIKKLNYLDY